MDPTRLLRATPSGAITIRERLMFYTRRDIGKIAVAASGGARLLAAKPNSVIGGVRIGIITYSFRALPSSADDVLKYCLDCGISAIELMSNVAESYAGAPAPGGRGGNEGLAPFRIDGQVQSLPQNVQ